MGHTLRTIPTGGHDTPDTGMGTGGATGRRQQAGGPHLSPSTKIRNRIAVETDGLHRLGAARFQALDQAVRALAKILGESADTFRTCFFVRRGGRWPPTPARRSHRGVRAGPETVLAEFDARASLLVSVQAISRQTRHEGESPPTASHAARIRGAPAGPGRSRRTR